MSLHVTDTKEPGEATFLAHYEGFNLGDKGITQEWAKQTFDAKRRWHKTELKAFAECLKAGGVHVGLGKPRVIEASEPMDGKSDWALTIEWPDGTETVELVSTAAAAVLGYHPATGETCTVSGVKLDVYDLVYIDNDRGGFIHHACCGPDREAYTHPDGQPLKPTDTLPTPMPFNDAINPAHMKLARDVTPDIEVVARQVAARFHCTIPVSGENLCESCWLPFVPAVEWAKRTMEDRPGEMTPGRALYEALFPPMHRARLYSLEWEKVGLAARVVHEFAARSAIVAHIAAGE